MAEEEKKEETTTAEEPVKEPASSESDSKLGGEAPSPHQEEKSEKEEPAKPAEPDWKDLYARLKADFDNYKKRAARDRDDVYRYAESDILGDILPTVDNLALALANATRRGQETAAPGKDGEAAGDAESLPLRDDPFVKGVQLVYDTLLKALKDHGAEPFDSVGKELDTEKMEAITMMPSADVDEGKVVAEVKRGWTLKGKSLRAAQVVVSSGKPA